MSSPRRQNENGAPSGDISRRTLSVLLLLAFQFKEHVLKIITSIFRVYESWQFSKIRIRLYQTLFCEDSSYFLISSIQGSSATQVSQNINEELICVIGIEEKIVGSVNYEYKENR